MPRSGLDNSDGDVSDGVESRTPTTFGCFDCPDLVFPSRSKLNRHRNTHAKPYRCVAGDCRKSFAQQQGLNRHTQTHHVEPNDPAKSYHCLVDSCKYSTTGLLRKRFTRLDQLKAHMKEKGHYGPHSANDRQKPPNKICVGLTIIAWYEECDGPVDSTERQVETCEFNSLRTKLWHLDESDKVILDNVDNSNPPISSEGFECLVAGCYFSYSPPTKCKLVLFKSKEASRKHSRRAHERLTLELRPISGPQDSGQQSIVSDIASIIAGDGGWEKVSVDMPFPTSDGTPDGYIDQGNAVTPRYPSDTIWVGSCDIQSDDLDPSGAMNYLPFAAEQHDTGLMPRALSIPNTIFSPFPQTESYELALHAANFSLPSYVTPNGHCGVLSGSDFPEYTTLPCDVPRLDLRNSLKHQYG
ncbi:hypothetical protein VTL71DRAFT_1383 [Oculimacula yallundae]|uniref:C2H2-type domain-containing protein n=1 Tax=Oculimacula yallundae TaxID=86028 RepID=A0ABR4CAP5_9HELO